MREVDEDPWLAGKSRLLYLSLAAKKPIEFFPDLPVTLAPHRGSTTVRVNTASMGDMKKSAPSKKKGLFSG